MCLCVRAERSLKLLLPSKSKPVAQTSLCLYSRARLPVAFPAVFLRSHKSLESVDPQFTIRRKMEQLREELELMEQLREVRWRPLAAVFGQGVVFTHLGAVCLLSSSPEHREQAESRAS